MKPMNMEESINQYKEVVAHKKDIYKQYTDCDKEITINKRKESLRRVHDATVAYAKLFHGPHYDELERMYKDAIHNYVMANNSVKDNQPTEVERVTLYQLFMVKHNAEQNLYGCVNQL